MAIDIRFPQITETTVEGQLRQLKSCLIQYSEKLNWALNTLEKNTDDVVVQYNNLSSAQAAKEANPEQMASTFTALKGYIIKSADIVNAYSEEITKKLEGIYTAEAAFPDGSAAAYIKKTTNEITATNDSITQKYETLDKLITDLDSRVKEINTDGYIKSGVLRYITEGDQEGAPLIGIEVGQTILEDGTEVFNKFSRLTANGLEFYDSNYGDLKKPVASITDYRLNISEAVIQSLVLGSYEVDTSDGIMFLWNDRNLERYLTIHVSAIGGGTWNQADIAVYINDNKEKTYSGEHQDDTLTFNYYDVSSAYIEVVSTSPGIVDVSTDGKSWINAIDSAGPYGQTVDLLSYDSDVIYIRHTYIDS